jgi:hypothetical protein
MTMEKRIETSLIQKVLGKYKSGYRYLLEAHIDYPVCFGIFKVGETEYMEDLTHLTDIEAQLCVNQLCYVFFAQCLIDHNISGLEKLTLQEYLDLEKENMYIIDNQRRYHKKIDSKKQIKATLELINTKEKDKLKIAKLNYFFNNKAAEGKLILGLKL